MEWFIKHCVPPFLFLGVSSVAFYAVVRWLRATGERHADEYVHANQSISKVLASTYCRDASISGLDLSRFKMERRNGFIDGLHTVDEPNGGSVVLGNYKWWKVGGDGTADHEWQTFILIDTDFASALGDAYLRHSPVFQFFRLRTDPFSSYFNDTACRILKSRRWIVEIANDKMLLYRPRFHNLTEDYPSVLRDARLVRDNLVANNAA